MPVIFILSGSAALVAGLALYRHVARLLSQLPGNNDGFTLEMREEQRSHDFFIASDSPLSSPAVPPSTFIWRKTV
ncbi:hypothetical protein [Noviherbaspirillum sedimenti]|nr:hypothetical protein [Noviherbaspirillum sedimenti]